MPLAHVQDACDAHVFLMDAPGAHGRYLCATGVGHPMAQIAGLLSSHYPPFKPAERREADACNSFFRCFLWPDDI